jgi:hypothetical protein
MLFPPPRPPPPLQPERPLPKHALSGEVRSPILQICFVCAATTAWGHAVAGDPYTPANPVVFLLMPFMIGILSNAGFGRLLMAASLPLVSATALMINVFLFGWVD